MSAIANSTGGRNVENVLHGYGNLATLEQTPPLTITGGRGIYIFDEDGGEYIEGAAGMWCASFGFSEPALIEAAIEQFHKLPYYHGLIDKTMLPMGKLAERLKAIAPGPMSKVFFANSGSEANDTLIKLIWYYNNSRGRPEKKKLIARDQAFHGLTVAAGSLTGIAEMHADFDLPIDRFLHTDCPHYYRYGHPGESEEDYAHPTRRQPRETHPRRRPRDHRSLLRGTRHGIGRLPDSTSHLLREGASGVAPLRRLDGGG